MQPRPLPQRLGPRPLPLHLGTALMTWVSSEGAWKHWKPGSPNSKPDSHVPDAPIPDALAAVLSEIASLEARAGGDQFERALRREITRRLHRLADGVLAYRQHAVHRTLEDPPAVWSEGNTRLLDYGATHRIARVRRTRAVLVVPSLINRWEVLDLTAEKSLLRAMAAAGLRPYLVDWGTPNDEERRFDTTAYVARLERALAFVAKRARRAPAVMGYCMGGTLTWPWRRASHVVLPVSPCWRHRGISTPTGRAMLSWCRRAPCWPRWPTGSVNCRSMSCRRCSGRSIPGLR